MNCREWQERIAAEDPEAWRHLEVCAGCRAFAAGLEESLELLRRAHRESPAEAALAAVRARLMARIAQPRRRWLPMWAGAAAAAAVLLFGWIRETPRPAPPPVAPPPPAVERVFEESAVPAKPKRAVHLRRMKKPPPEPVVVKLITDDPNVVIYWITDPKGD